MGSGETINYCHVVRECEKNPMAYYGKCSFVIHQDKNWPWDTALGNFAVRCNRLWNLSTDNENSLICFVPQENPYNYYVWPWMP